MISLFFNETGYTIEGELGDAIQIYDVPPSVVYDANALYCFRWYVFNCAIEQLREMGNIPSNCQLELHTDSRLVEELNGEIKTDNKYASDSRAYYIINDMPRFRKVSVYKCAPTTIQRKLDASKIKL